MIIFLIISCNNIEPKLENKNRVGKEEVVKQSKIELKKQKPKAVYREKQDRIEPKKKQPEVKITKPKGKPEEKKRDISENINNKKDEKSGLDKLIGSSSQQQISKLFDEALKADKTEDIEKLFNSLKDRRQVTAFVSLMLKGKLDLVKKLATKEIVNERSTMNEIPIFRIVKYKDRIEELKAILEYVDVHKMENRKTILMEAIEARNTEAAKIILGLDSIDLEYINIKDNYKRNALSYAAKHGNVEIFNKLLELGAELTPQILLETIGKTEEHTQIFNIALEQIDDNDISEYINVTDSRNLNALSYAAKHSNVEVFNKLLELGSNLTLNTLEEAIGPSEEQTEMFNMILQKILETDIQIIFPGELLSRAIEASNMEILESIIENIYVRSEYNFVGYNYSSLLTFAASKGKKDVVEFLLSKGVDVNSTNVDQQNALMAAVTSRNIDIVRLIANKTEDINAVDREGYTALQIAKKMKLEDIANLLIELGADPNIESSNRMDDMDFDLVYDELKQFKKGMASSIGSMLFG